ncbi:hypothetical protein DLAC_10098 [Tieghemostelium lacteum]|uniref:Ankyrin repeat-containing protein n=1 Tax=Tieghemostelium lacteum TaxID=361077 RepID=A0A151Z6M2_TIELA|nr:hypothetical protein DLAC_10098 [Tieghemostelium lacteum]|eukprot:KYQ89434.1 hypothetical protein DLAC_10098 [Tieghemostelium lacteum]
MKTKLHRENNNNCYTSANFLLIDYKSIYGISIYRSGYYFKKKRNYYKLLDNFNLHFFTMIFRNKYLINLIWKQIKIEGLYSRKRTKNYYQITIEDCIKWGRSDLLEEKLQLFKKYFSNQPNSKTALNNNNNNNNHGCNSTIYKYFLDFNKSTINTFLSNNPEKDLLNRVLMEFKLEFSEYFKTLYYDYNSSKIIFKNIDNIEILKLVLNIKFLSKHYKRLGDEMFSYNNFTLVQYCWENIKKLVQYQNLKYQNEPDQFQNQIIQLLSSNTNTPQHNSIHNNIDNMNLIFKYLFNYYKNNNSSKTENEIFFRIFLNHRLIQMVFNNGNLELLQFLCQSWHEMEGIKFQPTTCQVYNQNDFSRKHFESFLWLLNNGYTNELLIKANNAYRKCTIKEIKELENRFPSLYSQSSINYINFDENLISLGYIREMYSQVKNNTKIFINWSQSYKLACENNDLEFVKYLDCVSNLCHNFSDSTYDVLYFEMINFNITYFNDDDLQKGYHNDCRILDLLLNIRKDPNRLVSFSNKSSMCCAALGYINIIEYLYKNIPEAYDSNQIEHAIKNGHYNVVKFFLDHPNNKCTNCKYPTQTLLSIMNKASLLDVIVTKNYTMIAKIIQQHLEKEQKSLPNLSIRYLSVLSKEIFEIIGIQKDANSEKRLKILLLKAIYSNNIDLVEYLLDQFLPEFLFNNNLFLKLIHNSQIKMIKILLPRSNHLLSSMVLNFKLGTPERQNFQPLNDSEKTKEFYFEIRNCIINSQNPKYLSTVIDYYYQQNFIPISSVLYDLSLQYGIYSRKSWKYVSFSSRIPTKLLQHYLVKQNLIKYFFSS